MRRRQIWWTLAAAAAVVAVLAFVLATGMFGQDQGPSPERLALGQRVYDENCAACHGAELEGEPNWRERRADGTLPAPPHDETGHTWHHPDAQLFAITKEGTAAFAPEGYKTTMLGFGEVLSDDEIGAVLDYIKSRWPDDIRLRQAQASARASGAN
jgi:mono/diheme cytochrome c family protein